VQRGDLAPDFTLPDGQGVTRTLGDFLAGGPVVLFFYPAANTSGCTREACHFRDLAGEFAARGATLVGVSMDDAESLRTFAGVNRLDYPLLSDLDGAVARRYGVKRRLDLLRVKRSTFVIAPDRRLLEVITSELSMHAHADRALAVLAG
jgi:peroxiredoxin Q/BCP